MAKRKTKAEKIDIDYGKSNVVGWVGGHRINLNREMSDGSTLRDKLSMHISATLDTEIQNHEKYCKNLRKWVRQYRGKKKPKYYPHEKAANIAVPITRSNIDTIYVRILDAIFGRKKVIIVKPRPSVSGVEEETARKIENALDWFQRRILKLKSKLRSPLFCGTAYGTGVGKIVWESHKRTVYRYATKAEIDDTDIDKYDTEEGRKLVKDTQTLYEGPNIYPLDRSEVIISSDATDFDDAYLCGFEFSLRRTQLDLKVKQGLYDKSAVEKIVAPDDIQDNKKSQVESESKETLKTEYEKPYEFRELWLSYDVDEDGEEDEISVTFHRGSGQIVDAIYNPIFVGFRPFFKLAINPAAFAFDGIGLCEAQESLQEEVDTHHNQRVDRLGYINSPPTFTRAGIGLDDFKLTPGKNYPVDYDIETAFKIVPLPDVYPSTERAEDRAIGYMERVCGISPANLGISTSERPVAKETMALIEETNKKFKAYIDSVRDGIVEIFYKILEMWAQYTPEYSYTDDAGERQTIDFVNEIPINMIRDGLEIELVAATEMESVETRREKDIVIYQMLSDYMTKLGTMGQALVSPGAPPEFKKIILAANRISVILLQRILQDFDIVDEKELVLDISAEVDTQALLAPPMPPPGMMPPGGQGGGPPGPPGGGAGGGPPNMPPGMPPGMPSGGGQ